MVSSRFALLDTMTRHGTLLHAQLKVSACPFSSPLLLLFFIQLPSGLDIESLSSLPTGVHMGRAERFVCNDNTAALPHLILLLHWVIREMIRLAPIQ
jgi:hypothetical protein